MYLYVKHKHFIGEYLGIMEVGYLSLPLSDIVTPNVYLSNIFRFSVYC